MVLWRRWDDCTLRINRLRSDMIDSGACLQQSQGVGYKEHQRRQWGPTLPEVRCGIFNEPFFGRLETEVHEPTVIVDLWDGELYGLPRVLILFVIMFRWGSEVEIVERFCQ